MTDTSGYIFLAVIAVGAFFALRELWLWYWKINKVVSNQEETNRLLQEIRDLMAKE